MKDARLTIPNAALLSKVVDMLEGIEMSDSSIPRFPRGVVTHAR